MTVDSMLTSACRARGTADSRGWYEVYYVTAALPGGRAVWLRYTLDCPTGADATTSVWGVAFDLTQPRWFAARTTMAAGHWQPREEGGVDIGPTWQVAPDACSGAVRDSYGRRMRWELRWNQGPGPLSYFPERLEALARTSTFPIVCVPMARAEGTVEVDSEVIACDGVPVQQSHLFGGRHAHRWGWLHALGFDGDPDGFLTGVWAVPQRFSGRLPAVSSLLAGLHGEVFRSSSLRALRWVDRGGDVVAFRGRAGRLRVDGTAVTRLDRLCGVTYQDPDGSSVWCSNTEVADLRVVVSNGGRAEDLMCTAACGFERGSRVPQAHVWRPL